MIKYLWKKWICGYKNLFYMIVYFPKNFRKFLKELRHFLKHGYLYEAVYNHDQWFIEMEKKILEDYLEHHHGYPGREGANTDEEWDKILTEMIFYLVLVKDSYTDKDALDFDIDAKNKFFELYSKWFFDIWD